MNLLRKNKDKILILLIMVIAISIYYCVVSPLNKSEISLYEKKIIRKYGDLRSTGALRIVKSFKSLEDEMYYTIKINPRSKFVDYPCEIIVAFNMFLYLEENMGEFQQLKEIISQYNGNIVLEGPDEVDIYIKTEEYLNIKRQLKAKGELITGENLSIYWVESNYYNRGNKVFVEHLEFLRYMATQWNVDIYEKSGRIRLFVFDANSDWKNYVDIIVENYVNDNSFKINDVLKNDFIGAMIDDNSNIWLFFRSKLEIYNRLENGMWSEEPTEQLPDKSVIPPEIIKAYEYIYQKSLT